MKSRKLFVIGNGFDLHHGLRTSFDDFKSFIDSNYDNILTKYLYHIDIDGTIEEKRKIFWSDFENNISKVNSEALFEYAACYLEAPSLNEKWRESYWGDYQYELSTALQFGLEISEYLRKWIKNVELSIDDSIIEREVREMFTSDSLFFSFNYTDTLERIYRIASDKVCHIHGCIIDSDPLICGGERPDFELPIAEEDFRIREGNSILTRWQQTVWKNADYNISQHYAFFDRLSDIDEVIVMGSSMGVVDIPYFTKIYRSIQSEAKWGFYCHSEENTKVDSLPYKNFVKNMKIDDVSFVSW